MKICKGGCGNKAKYKGWCSDHFTRCPEYRKRTSERMIKENKLIQESLPYEKKNYPSRKIILWEEQGKKCNKCDYNLYDPKNGPYQIHHIDGNFKNITRDNEELICCNCHFMTDNYGFKGRKHNSKTKKLIAKNMNRDNIVNLYTKAAVG